MAVLLVLAGCMGRLELGDVGLPLLHPSQAKPPVPLVRLQPGDAGAPAPPSSAR